MEKFYPAYRVNSHFLCTAISSVKRHYRALYVAKHFILVNAWCMILLLIDAGPFTCAQVVITPPAHRG